MQPLFNPFNPISDPRSYDLEGDFPLDGTDLVTDETLVTLLSSAPVMHKFGSTKLVRLSRHLVLKGGGSVLPCEAETLKFVATKTGIRVPRVHRSFQVEDQTQYFGTKGYIVMDFIAGQSLDKCWTDLPDDNQRQIAIQVADMIKEMQSIEISQPAPFGGGKFRGRFFTDYSAGPLRTVLNSKAGLTTSLRSDISPRNLVLDRNGEWLIDWSNAGAYPPAFESAALMAQQFFPSFNEAVLAVIPRFPEEELQLDSITYGLITAALA